MNQSWSTPLILLTALSGLLSGCLGGLIEDSSSPSGGFSGEGIETEDEDSQDEDSQDEDSQDEDSQDEDSQDEDSLNFCSEICRAHFAGETGLTETHPGDVRDGILIICGGPESSVGGYIEPCVERCEGSQKESSALGCDAEFEALWRCTFPSDECGADCPEMTNALSDCKSS